MTKLSYSFDRKNIKPIMMDEVITKHNIRSLAPALVDSYDWEFKCWMFSQDPYHRKCCRHVGFSVIKQYGNVEYKFKPNTKAGVFEFILSYNCYDTAFTDRTITRHQYSMSASECFRELEHDVFNHQLSML